MRELRDNGAEGLEGKAVGVDLAVFPHFSFASLPPLFTP
jgi:hypothetical protein